MATLGPDLTPRKRALVAGILCAWGFLLLVGVQLQGAEMSGAARLAAQGVAWVLLGLGLLVGLDGTPLLRPLGGVALLVALGGFGLMANGLAFGSGPVECTRSVSALLLLWMDVPGDFECRAVAAALIAVPYDATALALLVSIPGLRSEATRLGRASSRLTKWILLVGFLPYLLLIALAVLLVDRKAGWERIVRGVRNGGAAAAAPPGRGG